MPFEPGTREPKVPDNAIDRGSFHWEEWMDLVKSEIKTKPAQVIARPLHPEMLTSKGYIRPESWSVKNGDGVETYKATVTYDEQYVVQILKTRFEQLGLIDGAYFSKIDILRIVDLIQEDHDRTAEKEKEKAVLEAAKALVRAGIYTDVNTALEVISKSPPVGESTPKPNSKGKKSDVIV